MGNQLRRPDNGGRGEAAGRHPGNRGRCTAKFAISSSLSRNRSVIGLKRGPLCEQAVEARNVLVTDQTDCREPRQRVVDDPAPAPGSVRAGRPAGSRPVPGRCGRRSGRASVARPRSGSGYPAIALRKARARRPAAARVGAITMPSNNTPTTEARITRAMNRLPLRMMILDRRKKAHGQRPRWRTPMSTIDTTGQMSVPLMTGPQ